MRVRPQFYRLIGRLPVPVDDIALWSAAMRHSRIVRRDHVGPLVVSTVFLGIDHNYTGGGDAILFETMIFGAMERDEFASDYCNRYATWDQALRGHAQAVEYAHEIIAKTAAMLEPKDGTK